MSNSANAFSYYENSSCTGTGTGQITEGQCFSKQGDSGSLILNCQEDGSVAIQVFMDTGCLMPVEEISVGQGICQEGTVDSFKNTCPVVASASASGIMASASGIIASVSEIVKSAPGAATSTPRAIVPGLGVPAHSQGGRLEIQLMPMFFIMLAALFTFKITRNLFH